MGNEAVKLELMEWLSNLEDGDTIEYLRIVKEATSTSNDRWNDLTKEQMDGIERGLRDIDAGRTTPHEVVRKKHGL